MWTNLKQKEKKKKEEIGEGSFEGLQIKAEH